MEISFVVNVLGWIGSVAVILAYVLVSFNRLKGDSLIFQSLNLVSGIFLLVNTFFWGAYPSSVVNLVWAGIAIFAMARILRRPKN